MRILAALGLIALFQFLSPATRAAGLPLVISGTVDYPHGMLTITRRVFSGIGFDGTHAWYGTNNSTG